MHVAQFHTCEGDGDEDGPHEEEEQKLSALRSTGHSDRLRFECDAGRVVVW